ncbi:PREDICTED: protein FAR1-RELATED SEQUENCE 5-like [Ipomoea nil]|uniref:protein FAR1-RELATED SEQUENCE 5-like n=1 Tax=Ipomoea nil TaxID=35883 RepID=UPI0009015DAB|nr:PREDICTED: protein FAR1-RELATED SEQUENCE 5-like [Ipomoea nil]
MEPAVDLEFVGGVCDKDNSTDAGVEGSGGCDGGNSTDVGVQDNVCDLEISPGLTKYWRPVCTDSLKPLVGQPFHSLDGAIVFYKQYAGTVGFDYRQSSIRKSRDGVVVEKHVVCNRQGFKQSSSSIQYMHGVDAKTTLAMRRRATNRVGCKAKVVVKLKSNGLYFAHSFEELHTYLMCSIIARQFLKVNRSLDAGHQMFIASCARANIGSVRSYRLFTEIVGEYSNVGATGVDFKNFKRDLMAHILNGDAQLFIDTFFKRRELCEAFDFEYDVDEVDQLSRVFWADAVSRKNFALFGDVSFDATYRTSMYKLIFVPFTGIDNHKRSINFGAGLLTREDVDLYVWLLEKFKKTMCHDPICVVTDQDLAVKLRLLLLVCLVVPVLSKDEVFRRKLNGIVWNKSLDSKSFEDAWSYIMEEYDLGDNGWFRYLFECRTFWASPYFYDEFMSGLRHAQAKLTADCESCFPVLKTPLALEKHAIDVYTISVFYDVQAKPYIRQENKEHEGMKGDRNGEEADPVVVQKNFGALKDWGGSENIDPGEKKGGKEEGELSYSESENGSYDESNNDSAEDSEYEREKEMEEKRKRYLKEVNASPMNEGNQGRKGKKKGGRKKRGKGRGHLKK